MYRYVNIGFEVRDNEHSLMCPTDRGNDPTVGNAGNGPESSNCDRNGPLHDDHWMLVQNPRRAWKKGDGVIKDRLV
jgi:hypothetical protein